MARDPSCDDIMGVVTPAGRFYLFSTAHLTAAEAWRRAHIEDAKLAIAARIRSDSRKTTLTSLTDLEPLFPSAEPAERAALLAELEADDRFQDLQKLEGPKGETYYHCETHLTGAYALIMMRAKTHDVSLAIAELVRDRSRILPRPTSIATFRDPVFGIDLALLDEAVARTLARHADIRKLVHPETGAAYLYSSRWLDDVQAFSMIDWEEVGAARNP
jgi:hypothetical protein